MANHKSAKVRIRRNARRNKLNTARRSRVSTFTKKVEAAIAAGDATAAEAALRAVQPELMRAASKHILRKETASRKMSRLSARIKALKQA